MISNQSKFTINVFGKHGCAKCTALNRRVDKFLAEEKYASMFTKEYNDVLTEDGLVRFCKAECLNPSRIPAMIISRTDADGISRYVINPRPGQADPVCKHSRLFQFLGIQTDYSEAGKGVISPEMIQTILDEALAIG